MSFKPKSNVSTEPYVHIKDPNIEYDDEVVVVIDGDVLAFKAAAAIETRFINAVHKSGRVKRFDNRTAFYGRGKARDGGWLAETNKGRKTPFLLDEFTIEDDREVEDISHALHTVKSMIDNTCMKCKTSKYEIYLEEGKNFRHSLCTAYPYKGNRAGTKPLLLKEVRSYIVSKLGGVVISGDDCLETDDMCAIRATEGYKHYLKHGKCNVIQSTNDKDALQVSGLLFNLDKMEEPLFIEGYGEVHLDSKGKLRGVGMSFLMAQMLMGDTIDNILPSKLAGKRFGDKGAFKVLEGTTTLKEGLVAVVNQYKEWYPKPIKYSHCITGKEVVGDWLSLASEFFILLYMRKSVNDKTTLATLLDSEGVSYA